jgi:hypothetical protein
MVILSCQNLIQNRVEFEFRKEKQKSEKEKEEK